MRLAVLARNNEELLAGLNSFVHDGDSPRVHHARRRRTTPVAGIPGQSSPRPANTGTWRTWRDCGQRHGRRLEPLWPGTRPLPVTLPPYPFARQRYWIPLAEEPEPALSPSETVESGAALSANEPPEDSAPSRLAIERELRSLATRFLLVPEQEIDVDTELVLLGFDSISLVQLVGELLDTYEIDVDEVVDAVLSGHLSLAALADYVEGASTAGRVPATKPEQDER